MSGAMPTLFLCVRCTRQESPARTEVIFAFAFLERMLLYTAVSSLANIGLPALSLVMTTHTTEAILRQGPRWRSRQ